MKTIYRSLLKGGISMLVWLAIFTDANAQDQSIKKIIESRDYIFKAQTATPQSGRTRQLTSEYTLKILEDSIIADLPYFGRAYSAPANLVGGGFQFTSIKFNYKAVPGKKDSWEINIKPEDTNGGENMSLTVYNNGRADLKVTSRDRQFISFSGYITGR